MLEDQNKYLINCPVVGVIVVKWIAENNVFKGDKGYYSLGEVEYYLPLNRFFTNVNERINGGTKEVTSIKYQTDKYDFLGDGPNIEDIQKLFPWTVKYSRNFRNNKEVHKGYRV